MDAEESSRDIKEGEKSPGGKVNEDDQKEKTKDIVVLDDDDEDEDDISEDQKNSEEVINLIKNEMTVNTKCINYACKSGLDMLTPPEFCLSFYRVKNKINKKFEICRECYDVALSFYDEMVTKLIEEGSLMNVKIPFRNDMVEIDDSDSDDEGVSEEIRFTEENMNFLLEEFDGMMLEVLEDCDFHKHKRDVLDDLKKRTGLVSDSIKEISDSLKCIQKGLDSMSIELYSQFQVQHQQLPAIEVLDGKIPQTTVIKTVQPSATTINAMAATKNMTRQQPQKNDASRLGSSHIATESKQNKNQNPSSSVKAMQSADGRQVPKSTTQTLSKKPEENFKPNDSTTMKLPPRGQLVKAAPKIGQVYYIARNMPIGSWIKGTLIDVISAGSIYNGNKYNQLTYVVTVEKSKILTRKYISGKEIAYAMPATVALEVGTRVIAAFREIRQNWAPNKPKKDQFYPGIVAEPLAAYNKYRYLIFFDDGYVQYVTHDLVHLIYEASKNVWEDIHEGSRMYIKKYLESYPERPMVRLLKDQQVQTEYNGKWMMATVMNIDCSLVQMHFEGSNRIEWIYRGSTRLSPLYQEEQAATSRLRNHQRTPRKLNNSSQPFVQYTRSDPDVSVVDEQQTQQRAVARKSTSKPQVITNAQYLGDNKIDAPPSKIVYYTPRKQKPNVDLYKPHNCSERCKQYMLSSLSKLVTYNPLAKPLLCGFNRLMYKYKNKKHIVYKAPCGRTCRNMPELHHYLTITKSDLTVDLFDFDYWVRCLAEFMLEPKIPFIKDLSNGNEEVPIAMVNYVDNIPQEFCDYSNKRMPMYDVNLNLDEDFLVGCDCEDDCANKKTCACWQLTLEGRKYLPKDLDDDLIGYNYRRLLEPIATGIYECNQRCKCAKTCLNRVVQNPLQHKLQVFKTHNRGWGIRCLNDIPQGSFVCIYAGCLLTDQMANEGGKCYGDEYYAELDYIECAERWKEDYEAEVVDPEGTSAVNVQNAQVPAEDSDTEIEEIVMNVEEDRDFKPSMKQRASKNLDTSIRSRLRKRTMEESENDGLTEKKLKEDVAKKLEETVTISDEEDEGRETLSFNPVNDPKDESRENKYKSVREMFGPNESVYIMDAKSSGNIGRFLNHSCSPNIFVQNVFVDTHDLRFPWVAFFAMNYIRAGTELTWNYNYDIGSVPGKVLYCYCNSTECKGRLL